MQVYPILFGKESKQMTKAQKGDAIVKILGGSVVSLCGIGIEMLLKQGRFPPKLATWSCFHFAFWFSFSPNVLCIG